MTKSVELGFQKDEGDSSESWLSDATRQSPSPAPLDVKKTKQKRKRRKYHGTANPWTDEEVQKLLRRRASGESWEATIAAFPDRTKDAVVKRYSTMKCEGKSLTPRKFEDSDEDQMPTSTSRASKRRRKSEGAEEQDKEEDTTGVINVHDARIKLNMPPAPKDVNAAQSSASQPVNDNTQTISAGWTSVNHAPSLPKSPALTKEEVARLHKFNKRGELVRRQMPQPWSEKSKWKAIRDRGELMDDGTSLLGIDSVAPITKDSNAESTTTQSRFDIKKASKISSGDHYSPQNADTRRTSSIITSPMINSGEVQLLTESELSHRGVTRRVEQFLLMELRNLESIRASKEMDLEKTINDLMSRAASLESCNASQAETLKHEREVCKDVIQGMDEKVSALDQEKKDIELDKIDLRDKLTEAEDRVKAMEEQILILNQEHHQNPVTSEQVVKEREAYEAKIQELEKTISSSLEKERPNTKMLRLLRQLDEVRGCIEKSRKEVSQHLQALVIGRKEVESHQAKMADVRMQLDGDLSDFTGKMIKGLEDGFKEEFNAVRARFDKFGGTLDEMTSLVEDEIPGELSALGQEIQTVTSEYKATASAN